MIKRIRETSDQARREKKVTVVVVAYVGNGGSDLSENPVTCWWLPGWFYSLHEVVIRIESSWEKDGQ